MSCYFRHMKDVFAAAGVEVTKEAMHTNRTVREVVVEKGYLTAGEADRLLDVRSLTEGGIQG